MIINTFVLFVKLKVFKNDNDDLLKNIQFGKAMDILHKKLNAIKI